MHSTFLVPTSDYSRSIPEIILRKEVVEKE
jgi:hypothetical protein